MIFQDVHLEFTNKIQPLFIYFLSLFPTSTNGCSASRSTAF